MSNKKWTMIGGKLIAITALAAALMLTAGCSNDAPVTEEPGTNFGVSAEADPTGNQETATPPAQAPAIAGDFVVATLNGANINASDIGFQIRQAEEMLMWDYIMMFEEFEIDYDRDFRDGYTFGQYLRRQAVRSAALNKLMEEYARGLGIELGDDVLEMIEADISFFEEEYSTDEFADILRSAGVADRTHLKRIFMQEDLARYALYTIIETPEQFARFEHYMPADPSEGAEERATSILERALAGEDFDSLIATYGEDPGMVANPEGYTFTEGMMVPEFEAATRILEVGEISPLVPTNFGFHIIKRVEPNMDNIMGDGDEILAAKHILINAQSIPLETRMVEAVNQGFLAMLENADFVILSEIDNVPVEIQ